MRFGHLIIASSLLLLGAVTSAQNTIVLPKSNEKVELSFFDGNPGEGSRVSTAFAVHVNDSPVGRKIHNVEDADHVVLKAGGLNLAFETLSINSTSSTYLKGVNDNETLTLGEVVKGIYASARGEKNLAIFTEDGVVTGFYAYYPGAKPGVNIENADHLVLAK